MKSIKDFDLNNKKVLVRCDFNVPVDQQGNILDDFRIKKTLPTITYLLSQNAKIILMSHLGEPNGKVIPTLTLDNVKDRLEQLLNTSIIKTDDCIGKEVEKQVLHLKPGEILLLENLRFHSRETDNDLEFAKDLAKLGEIYINDAFGDCHRAHASIVALAQLLPSGAGLLLQSEIENLNNILQHPKKPLVAIVGGIKVGTKAKFIAQILKIADFVLVGGLIKKEMIHEKLEFASSEKIISSDENLEAPDISENTIALFKEKIMSAKTIVWNGPLGKFEDEHYKKGTLEVANAIIASGAFCVAGGGETIEFLNKEGMLDKFSHVSTGGGAMLDYLSGEELPGLKALE